MKNHEISEIAISRLFFIYPPTFPLSYFPRVFSPGAPAENLGGGRFFSFFWKQRARRGGNPPTWAPSGIALQKRRFSKKDGKIKMKNPYELFGAP